MAQSDTPDTQQGPEQPLADRLITQPVGSRKPSAVFLYAGLVFLFVALGLFLLAGYLLYDIGMQGPKISIESGDAALSDRDVYNFYGTILGWFFAPFLILVSAIISTFIGIKLLRSAGVVAQEVIPQRDYDLLAPAIEKGNDKAIAEYIKLSSLSGMTGTFTKVGLTGLPLATIFLTVILSVAGLFVDKFFDLAQLTLGAFIGSFVQKRKEGPDNPQPTEG